MQHLAIERCSNNSTISSVVISGNLGQNVSWTNAVGVSVSGNSLTKTAATGWGNSGAVSTQTITSGDGYVETTVGADINLARFFGLSDTDVNQHYTSIDFGLLMNEAYNLIVYESGTSRGTVGTYAAGDKLRVAVEGGIVMYRKNGALLYTSSVGPTYPLLVDTALYSAGSTLTNVTISTTLGATINWLVADQLGTPRMVFDKTGSLATTKRHDYLPFGEELIATQGLRTTALGYTADTVRQKFTSYERDTESGLDYAQARYYSNTQGRFTSVDPLMASASAGNPQTWNRYAYVGNDPLNATDPSGMIGSREPVDRSFTKTDLGVYGNLFSAVSYDESWIDMQKSAVAMELTSALWPPGTHDEILAYSLPGLDPDFLGAVQAGSREVDAIGGVIPITLIPGEAYKHAMVPGP
ncbi:MAG: RHS repeat-associated core domain-containing protein [Pyrinomonadaceae bacterium]